MCECQRQAMAQRSEQDKQPGEWRLCRQCRAPSEQRAWKGATQSEAIGMAPNTRA